MKVNSIEAHTIKAMIGNTIAEKKNNQKVEVPVSDQRVVAAKEVAMSSEILDLVNNTHAVEGHLQKWRGSVR
ncbi:hypothetical protein [Solibacillus sp. NPDC093137]|uniref:hypothetical protein n=1 Tax=Solibacillus sp. NPDC093137 TaxID=3390678 RepID=UPI003D02CF22